MKLFLLIPVVLAFISTTSTPVGAQSPPLEGLDAYVEKAMKAWDVPALALVVVKDDEVIHARGYGTLTSGGNVAVNKHTIFGIGSTTKAFTAAALAMLVDEGRITWDDRVVDHLEWFRLYDTYATRNITIRDLLSHTSGLSRGDRMWYNRNIDREEVVRRVRYQEPATSFRQKYNYSNTMFTTAGLVVKAVTGIKWDEFVMKRILSPLDMSRTTTTVKGLDQKSNVAGSYTYVADSSVAIPRWNQDNIGPAGSLNSTAVDMAKWLRFQLRDGMVGDKRLISEELMHEMREAQTVIKNGSTYGLGWRVEEYEGRKIVRHGGGGHGVAAKVAMIPSEELGIVVLSNSDGQSLPAALVRQVLDALLGLSDRDWSEQYLAARDRSIEKAAEREQQLVESRIKGTAPSHTLEAYTGIYRHTYYGQAEVWQENDQLHFRFVSEIEGPLEHWHYNTFRADWDHPRYGKNFITFLVGSDGVVYGVRIPPEYDTSILVDFKKISDGEDGDENDPKKE